MKFRGPEIPELTAEQPMCPEWTCIYSDWNQHQLLLSIFSNFYIYNVINLLHHITQLGDSKNALTRDGKEHRKNMNRDIVN